MASDRIALVTGASRGAGRGIALALGDAGMTVYVTGRTRADDPADLGGSIEETARAVTDRGGVGIAVPCDHADDRDTAAVLERISADHDHLDVLVNNAFAVPSSLTVDAPFWELPLDLDQMFTVGLRSTYVTSALAAPLLIARPERGALVVNTSGFGGGCFMHGPAYGAVKAGVDKMAHDMAVDFRPYGVTAVSVWMGLLRTERTMRVLSADPDRYRDTGPTTESPEFTGRVIAALAAHPDRLAWSGRVLVGAEMAAELGVEDIDGTLPASRRPRLGNPPSFSDAVVR